MSTTAQLDPNLTTSGRGRWQRLPLLEPESIIGGRYLVGERLGSGAMGTVFAVRDLGTGRDGAVKVTAIDSPARHARFRRSVESRDALDMEPLHPAILPLWASGELDGGLGYLVAPRLSPRGYDARINREAGHDFDAMADVLGPMAGALADLHGRGWIHRDFKPGNILSKGISHFLCDFGLAKRFGSGRPDSGRIPRAHDEVTGVGYLCGTPLYMSSQRLFGAPATPEDDVFSLALSMVELLLGVLPRDAQGRSVLTLQARREKGISLPPLDCPSVVTRLIRRGLSPDPAERPAASDFELLLS